MRQTESWGRMLGKEEQVQSLYWQQDLPQLLREATKVLCYGLGRSYGDSCLAASGLALIISSLNKLKAFDPKSGLITVEAGLSMRELLDFIVPRGWFIPVSPGTKFVTMGGAIANDVHGKNHHVRGTIGRHITELELVRSNGEKILCSPQKEQELFAATIGGLGLTGVISWCSLQLIPIQSALIAAEHIRTQGLDDFFALEDESAKSFEYTVSWIDCMAQGSQRGRGIFIRGNHHQEGHPAEDYANRSKFQLSMPTDAPSWVLNPLSIRVFNEIYYRKQVKRSSQFLSHFDPFFYPLDKILHWNRGYGKHGLFQYQFVMPLDKKSELAKIFDLIAVSGQGSFLAVLKKFGHLPSPGLLSFPQEGYTLTLDFQNRAHKSLALFEQLDKIVAKAGGRLYPAKDASMSPKLFQQGYPNWQAFAKFIDPKFNSLFWQRVTRES